MPFDSAQISMLTLRMPSSKRTIIRTRITADKMDRQARTLMETTSMSMKAMKDYSERKRKKKSEIVSHIMMISLTKTFLISKQSHP